MSDTISREQSVFLNLNVLTFASTQILLFTLFPYLSEKLNLPLSLIIGSFTLGTVMFLWGAPYWSSKSDFLGKQLVMTLGLAGLFLSFALIAALVTFSDSLSFYQTAIILVLSRIIYGSFASAIVPLSQAIRSSLSKPEEQMRAMFTHSLALNLGRALGPILILLFGQSVVGLLYALTAWSFILVILNSFKIKSNVHASKNVQNDLNDWKNSLKEISWPLVITLLLTTFTGVLHSSLSETIKSTFSLSSIDAGEFMAKVLLAGTLAMAFIQVLGKTFSRSKWKMPLILGIFSLVVGSIVLFNMREEYQAWISVIFISIGIALIQPSNLTMLHSTSSDTNLSKNIGLLSSGNTIGYAIGGGLAAFFLGQDITLLTLGIALCLGSVVIVTCKRIQYADS